MALDPRIPLMAEGIPIEPRMNALMRAGQMQGMQQQNAMREMQMQQLRQAMAAEAEQRKRQEAQQQEMQGYLASLSGRAGPPQQFNPMEALMRTRDPKIVEFLANAPTMGLPKVARVLEQAGPDGRPQSMQFDEFGRPVGAAVAKPVEAKMMDLGGTKQAYDPYAVKPGQTFKSTMTPGEIASDARARDRLRLDQEKFALEKSKPAGDAAPRKPLPTSALKMQQDALDAIGVVGGINADLKALEDQIENGSLSFGPISNVYNTGRNMAGMSSQESRNFATFRSNMERLRNESLRLNTGVQTDGDAQRAWNELFQNITDTNLVKQRLQEIQRINARGAELQKLKLDQVRANYGYEPMDVTPQAVQPPALKGEVSNKLTPAEQAELEQLRKRFGK